VKALVVITNTTHAKDRIRVSFSDRFLREFDDDVATEFFQVFDEEGDSVERSDSLGKEDLPRRLGTLREPLFWNLALPNGEPGRAIGIRFEPQPRRREDRDRDAEAGVVVAAGRRELDATLVDLRNILLGGGASLLGLTVLVVPLVLRRGLRPLNAMAERAAHIDAGSLETRFPVEPMPLELQPIAGRLNDVFARLEESFERERRFSSDLAHELRTPLAELRTQAEVALKWPEERTAAADRAVLEIALHLERLVTHLLALGRAEQAQLEPQANAVQIPAAVGSILQSLAARASARGLEVEQSGPAALEITTDAVLFKSIAGNLLENAIAHAPAGSSVRVSWARNGERFRLEVANPAGDLGREDLAHMFERFWRRDRARTGSDHVGLGLALSRSFARVLGLELEAELDEGGVLTMSLHGPAGPFTAEA
jgi:two-component system sensor histidine kinase QseC